MGRLGFQQYLYPSSLTPFPRSCSQKEETWSNQVVKLSYLSKSRDQVLFIFLFIHSFIFSFIKSILRTYQIEARVGVDVCGVQKLSNTWINEQMNKHVKPTVKQNTYPRNPNTVITTWMSCLKMQSQDHICMFFLKKSSSSLQWDSLTQMEQLHKLLDARERQVHFGGKMNSNEYYQWEAEDMLSSKKRELQAF